MTDPWRYRCPEGHTAWAKRVNGVQDHGDVSPYYCEHCGPFDQLVDAKTGERV